MQSISRINTYRNCQAQQYSNKNLKQYLYLPQQSIVFTSNPASFKDTITNKYLNFRLKKVLKDFDLISQHLDKNKFEEDVLSNKYKTLLNHVAKKTKTMLFNYPIESNFHRIESLIDKQEINLSLEQKTELFKRFDLSKNRKKLIQNSIEPLEFLKNSKLFEGSTDLIQNTINKMSRAIRCFGLSEEVKNIVIKSESSFGVKLDIPNSPDLSKNIYSWLIQHKKTGHTLPRELSFNDFDFFTTHNSELSASYVSGIKPSNYEEIISKYPSLTNKFSKKQIFFNPIFLILRQSKNDSASVIEDLEHELGHYWHNLEIGDKAFHSKRMNNIDGFLSIKDNNFLLDLKNKLSEKVYFVPNLNLEGKIDENLSEIIPDLKNMIDHKQNLEIEEILTEKTTRKFYQIIQKLEALINITSKNFSDCPDEIEYALTSPKELVAFAIQKRHNHKYDPEFIKTLKKFGLPEIKD